MTSTSNRNSEDKTAAPPRKLSLWKRILFVVVADVAVLLILAIIGEFVCRMMASENAFNVISRDDMTLSQFSDDAYLGWELRPNQYDHNSHGFRGRETTVDKPRGLRRIAVVGDSVTYGLGLKAEESYPSLLEEQLTASGGGPLEVLNFGVPGYSSFQGYTLLKKRVLRFQPDLVIMTFSPDDVETSPVVINIDGQMCLFRNQLEGVGLLNNSLHWWTFQHSYLYRYLYKCAVLAFATGSKGFDEVYVQPAVQWENVRRAASLCAEEDIEFLLVLSPFLYPHYRPAADVPPESIDGAEMLIAKEDVDRYRRASDEIREFARRDGIELVDLGPLYKQHGAAMKLMPIDHEHLSPHGCRLVAETVAERIQSNAAIPNR